MRVAVPRAWVRARRTILSADTVSFLAAAILYYFAAGDVKGFAFTLGLSTILDLVVVFLFTHPLVSLLSRSAAFGSARFTGLNAVRAAAASPRPPRRRRGASVASRRPAPAPSCRVDAEARRAAPTTRPTPTSRGRRAGRRHRGRRRSTTPTTERPSRADAGRRRTAAERAAARRARRRGSRGQAAEREARRADEHDDQKGDS